VNVKSRITIIAAIVMAILSCIPRIAVGQNTQNGPEQILLESANRDRGEKGLPLLKWDSALAAAARQHALRLAQQNTLSHQLPGEPDLSARAGQAGARFSSIAENVAEGPNVQGIHEQWMNSPPHRANLLDPELTSVGIAVVRGNGAFFAVEDFSNQAGQLSLQDQENLVVSQLQMRGIRILNYTSDARKTCLLDNGYTGSHEPSFVLHYATPSLQKLPDMLEQRIQTRKYHSGAVGACQLDQKAGLTGYRIAVMLYE
jgi:cysteine-rich secretory family protein